ncbi:MAG TPA: hypothetical protein VH062_10240 [Polyangiaceae bacterium]|jgi:hypothetical protein|nr:hypothetical protein [Polyangiaceae bacterium]
MSIESFIQDHATLTPEQMAAKYPLSYAHPASIAGRRIHEQPVAKHVVPADVLDAPAKDLGDQVADLLLAQKYGCESLEEAIARGFHKETT